jgi:response regulator RpfG family c-di-GMP phosphodiesterase
LTASAFNEDREAVLAAGCDDFVRRPFRESEIYNKVHEHLGVTYIYEHQEKTLDLDTASSGLSARAIKSAVAHLPRSAVKEFKTAIELSDMERMTQVVSEIGVGHGELARGLKKLVDTFQFDRLLGFLDGIEGVSEESMGEKT